MKQESTPFVGLSNQALGHAVAQGDTQQIGVLASPESVRQRGEHQVTMLQWAILAQQPTSVRALLQAGADAAQTGLDGNSALHTAAQIEDAEYLSLLLTSGASINVSNSVTGATPLAAAVLAGREKQVKVLLEAGANSSLADRLGDTPLHVAAKTNAPQLALMLLQAGADAKARNQQGLTFIAYFSQTPSHLQNEAMREAYKRLEAWLRAHRLATQYASS